jgi:hypothetical protein
MRTIWTILVAIAFALVGKSVGRFYAKTHLTDDTSAILTVSAHRVSLKRVGRVAIGAFLAWLVMIVLSSFIARWITIIGWAPLIVMNCCLALLAGTASSISALARRPYRWDMLQAMIEQRERLIEYLKRFLPVLIVVTMAAVGTAQPVGTAQAIGTAQAVGTAQVVGTAQAVDACFFGVDLSPSVNMSDAQDARKFLKTTAQESTRLLGCKRVVAVSMGCEVRFARRVWLDVPVDRPSVDCSKVEPEPLKGHSSFWEFVRGISDSRKEEAVQRCREEQTAWAQQHQADIAAFADSLDAAFANPEPQRCSRIAASIRDALDSGLYRAIVVTSDMVDNPATSLRDVVVPPGTRLIIILTRSNPAYASAQDSLARATGWSRIPGVAVVTTAELRPDLWRSVVQGPRR